MTLPSGSLPPALAAALEQLYEVSGRYPLKRHVEGCTCGCIPPGAEAALHRHPLRKLAAEDLERYAYKALTTWGDEEDFKHFLPRLLELLVSRALSVNEEIVLGELSYGRWWTWPPQERDAVAGFLRTWWAEALCLDAPQESWYVETVLTALAQAEDDLTPYLEQWDRAQTPSARYHMAAFVMSNAGELVWGKLTSAFWEDRQPQARQVVGWLLTERQQHHLEEAGRAFGATERAKMFEHAAYTLGVARSQHPASDTPAT